MVSIAPLLHCLSPLLPLCPVVMATAIYPIHWPEASDVLIECPFPCADEQTSRHTLPSAVWCCHVYSFSAESRDVSCQVLRWSPINPLSPSLECCHGPAISWSDQYGTHPPSLFLPQLLSHTLSSLSLFSLSLSCFLSLLCRFLVFSLSLSPSFTLSLFQGFACMPLTAWEISIQCDLLGGPAL